MHQINKNNIICSILIWYLAFISGILFADFSTNYADYYIKLLSPKIYYSYTENYASSVSFNKILLHNFELIIILILGSFTLSISSVFGLFINGFAAGLIVFTYINILSLYILCFLILPHGLFEFPSIWLAGAAGLKGPQVFLRYLRGGEFVTRKDVKEYLTLSALSVVLIVIAAWIEANITPKIAERFLP